MTADEEPGGSPPCLACEMDPAYAGFLPPAELAAALVALLPLAERAPEEARKRWLAVLEPALARLPPPSGAPRAQTEDDLADVVRKLLPRIADDRLHAALKAVAAS